MGLKMERGGRRSQAVGLANFTAKGVGALLLQTPPPILCGPASPFRGHLSTRSNAFCIDSCRNLTGQYLIRDHMVFHYNRILSAKAAVDCSVPRSRLTSIKFADQQRREKLKKKIGGCEEKMNVCETVSRSCPRDGGGLLPSSYRKSFLEAEDNLFPCGGQAQCLARAPSPFCEHGLVHCSSVKHARKRSRNVSRASRSSTSRPPSKHCGLLCSHSIDNCVSGGCSQRCQGNNPKVSSGDLLERHSEYFTKSRKPFTPRTLLSNAKSLLAEYRYYTPARRKKKNRRKQRVEAETQTDIISFPSGDKLCVREVMCEHQKNPSKAEAETCTLDEPERGTDDCQCSTLREMSQHSLKSSSRITVKDDEEELLYLNFIEDVTNDILRLGLFSNRVLDQLFECYIEENKDHLDEEKMRQMLDVLKSDLGCSQDSETELTHEDQDSETELMHEGQDSDTDLVHAGLDSDTDLVHTGLDSDTDLVHTGLDSDTELSHEGLDSETELSHEGLDSETELSHEGLDRKTKPIREGLDRKTKPIRAGLDRKTKPIRAGLDRKTKPIRAGLDRKTKLIHAGLDSNTELVRDGQDSEIELSHSGLDRKTKLTCASLDSDTELVRDGQDSEIELSHSGLDKKTKLTCASLDSDTDLVRDGQDSEIELSHSGLDRKTKLTCASLDSDTELVRGGQDSEIELSHSGLDRKTKLTCASLDSDTELVRDGQDSEIELSHSGLDRKTKLIHAGLDSETELIQASQEALESLGLQESDMIEELEFTSKGHRLRKATKSEEFLETIDMSLQEPNKCKSLSYSERSRETQSREDFSEDTTEMMDAGTESDYCGLESEDHPNTSPTCEASLNLVACDSDLEVNKKLDELEENLADVLHISRNYSKQ